MKKSKRFIATATATGGLMTSLFLTNPGSALAATDQHYDTSSYSVDVNDSLDNDALADFEESLFAQGLSPSQVRSVISSAPHEQKVKSFRKRAY